MPLQSENHRRAPASQETEVPKEITKAQLKKLADEAVDFVNKAVRESGRSLEKIAPYLFERLFDADVTAALTSSGGQLPKYVAVAERAGESMLIDRSTLSRAVRIGAVTHALGNADWAALSWTLKVELLPMLGRELSFDALLKGVEFASRKGTGMRAVREWIAAHRRGVAPIDGMDGEPTPKTPRATAARTRRLFDLAPMLQKVADRRLVADGVSKLPTPERAAFAAGLRATIRHLTKLAEEMELVEA